MPTPALDIGPAPVAHLNIHIRIEVRLCSPKRDVVFLVPALQDLMKLRRKESQLNQVIAEAQGATTRLKYSGVELEVLRKKNIVRCQTVGVACRCCSIR